MKTEIFYQRLLELCPAGTKTKRHAGEGRAYRWPGDKVATVKLSRHDPVAQISWNAGPSLPDAWLYMADSLSRIGDRLEIMVRDEGEAVALIPWLVGRAMGEKKPLPLPEYQTTGLTSRCRWTATAWEAYTAAQAKVRT